MQSDSINGSACLIFDVNMPGLSGVELQSRLVAQGNSTPIIFVTAAPDAVIRASTSKAGAIGILSKPFREESLVEHLDVALKRRQDGSIRQ